MYVLSIETITVYLDLFEKIMNWQVGITIYNSYSLRTNNRDNYPYILQ